MFKFSINKEALFLFAFKNKRYFIYSFASLLILIITILTFLHFQEKKKASLSAQLAIGFAYLNEGKKEISLVYFEKVFNESSSFYNIIAGSGVVKALEGTSSSSEKIINVLKLMEKEAQKPFFQNLISSILLSNIAIFQPENLNQKKFEKFEKFANKNKFFFFKEKLANINLNLKKEEEFIKISKALSFEGFLEEKESPFTVKQRVLLYKSL